MDIATYIERGILAPARDVLTTDASEHMRLAVLLPGDEEQCFVMVWAAGATLPRPDEVPRPDQGHPVAPGLS